MTLTAAGVLAAGITYIVLNPSPNEQQAVAANSGKILGPSNASAGSVIGNPPANVDNVAAGNDGKSSALVSGSDEIISKKDQQRIFKLLSEIELDQDGNMVIDHSTLVAVDGALGYHALNLDEQGLVKFQNLIKTQFPGHAGEQMAELAANYYRFLQDREEFNTRYADTTDIVEHKMHFEELLALREAHFGSDVAARLFKKTNADARFMLDSLEIQQDTSLTQEQRRKRHDEINERHKRESITISNWEQRYETFLGAKQLLLNSTLPESEKRVQLQALLQQHFDPAEIEQVSFMKLDTF